MHRSKTTDSSKFIKKLCLTLLVFLALTILNTKSIFALTVDVINRTHLKEGNRDFIDGNIDDNFNYEELQATDTCPDIIKGFNNKDLKGNNVPSSAKIIIRTQNQVNTNKCDEREEVATFSNNQNFSIAFLWVDANTIRTTDNRMLFRKDDTSNIFKDAISEDRCVDTLTVNGSFPSATIANLQEREYELNGNHEYEWFPFSISSRKKNNSNECNESEMVTGVKIGLADNDVIEKSLDKSNLIPAPPPPCSKRDPNAINPHTRECTKFDTGFGTLSTDAGGFISSIFRILLASAGAIALILIIRAGFKIMTSEGNPEKVKEGRDQLIAALVGLIFLIFSLVFLELIGVNLLKIDQFGGNSSSINNPNTPPLALPPIDKSPFDIDTCSKQLYKLGNSGKCVEAIQGALNINPIDGTFDSRTEGAVRVLQAEQGIFPDGTVGPCTWGVFIGFPIDSVCSQPLTESVLRNFQDKKGLFIDGTLNPCTWEALIGDPNIPDSCRR